jgi:hypothetical protein
MRGSWSVLLAALLGLCLVRGATGAPDNATAPAQAPDAIAKQESAARAKAGDEMASLARFCATTYSYDDARQAWAKALAMTPANKLFRSELEKLKGRKSTPPKTAAPQIAERRKKGLAKCSDLLGPVVGAYLQAGRSDDLARVVSLMRAQELPVETTLTKLGIVFFEPYLDWRSKQDVDRLNAGEEYVDGQWLPKARVAELDAAHTDWSDPWVVGDEVHEVRTTLPLRTARRVLAHVAAYRRFFLSYFTGEWDLQPPKVKLPVIVTGTRAEMEERAANVGAGGVPPGAAAFYMSGPGEGNPCFVSFEVRDARGATIKVGFKGLRWVFEHEIGHQIAFEYSKHAGATRPTSGQFWCVEGVAQFLPHYDLVDGTWVLTRPQAIPMGNGYMEGDFAWCRAHVDAIPPLDKFFAQSYEEFMSPTNYHIGATLAWFLLEGKDRAYRTSFVKLLETVHQAREDDGTVAACFEGVDVAALDAEFRAFCREIKLD